MKSLLVSSIAILFSISSYASSNYECYPELGDGPEVLELELNFETPTKGAATLFSDGNIVQGCESRVFSADGDVREYGEYTLVFTCEGGDTVEFKRAYAEEVLDVWNLYKREGWSDDTFQCS